MQKFQENHNHDITFVIIALSYALLPACRTQDWYEWKKNWANFTLVFSCTIIILTPTFKDWRG